MRGHFLGDSTSAGSTPGPLRRRRPRSRSRGSLRTASCHGSRSRRRRSRPTGGSEIAYDGEDRDWLLGLTREAEHSINAISLSTVDAGMRGFDGGLWTSDLGPRYLELQREAIKRKVSIRRIFVFENQDLARDEIFRRITQAQREAGIDVRTLDYQLIPAPLRAMTFDFILFDEVVGYETTPAATSTAGKTSPTVVRTRLAPKTGRVGDLKSQFDQLWNAADPERSADSGLSSRDRGGRGTGHGSGSGQEPEVGQPSNRFLTGILPEQAPASARISLLVQVTRAAVPPASAALKGFPVTSAGTRVAVTVSAPGLVPLGDLDQDLLVPFAGDSEPVRFGFRTRRVGLHTVKVRAFAGGTCLGELSLQISVESGVRVEESRPRAALMAGLAAEPGEVTLQVSRTVGGGYSFQLLGEALHRAVLIDRLAGDPAQVVAKITAELQKMAGNRSPYASAAHARNRLRALGAELWADVVPEAIRSQFWAQRDSIKLFTIASDMDAIPWELVYPVDRSSEYGFLIEQFPVVRRVYGQNRTRFLHLNDGVGFIIPPRAPTNALDEVSAVRGILPAGVADRGVAGGLDGAVELLNSMPSVLHFAGHSAFTDGDGSVISLDGGPLRPDDLSYYKQRRAFAESSPLVFLNGCRTAGEIPGFAQMNGWAEKFMGAGAGAFVGSLWAVRSSSAKVFAEEFYRELITMKQPLGIASLRARRAVAADSGDPTWLAYTIYGNPSASVLLDSASAL